MSDRNLLNSPGGKFSTRLVIIGLCALVGFTAVAQAQQKPVDTLAGLRQTELVQLIDEITARIDALESERSELLTDLQKIESGVTSRAEAIAAGEERIRILTIQAGTVPVHGPGVELTVRDPDRKLTAQSLVTLIEELRNAGAEAIEIENVRVGTSTWVSRSGDELRIDGTVITPPYTVRAIGDVDVISVALEMPGGVLAAFRSVGATTSIVDKRDIEILSTRKIPELKHAEIVE